MSETDMFEKIGGIDLLAATGGWWVIPPAYLLFVTLTTNPALYSMQSRPPDYRQYGFEIQLPESAYEGAPLVWTIHLDDSSFEIENYYLSKEAHLSAFEDAGFRDIRFHELTLSPNSKAGDEGNHWEEILNYSPAVIIEGFKV